MAGLTGNTDWYNVTMGITMLMGRYLMIVPALAIAGSLAAKKTVPGLGRHLPDAWRAVHRPSDRLDRDRRWPDILPALAVGPLVEHLAVSAGQTFGSTGG